MPLQLRPRFSLRWILVLFAFVGVILYLFFVRPTVIAQQLIASVKSPDFKPGSLLPSDDGGKWTLQDAYLQPREWTDVWKCQRRVQVHATLPGAGGGSTTHMLAEYSVGPLQAEMRQLQLVDSKD